MAYIIPLLYQKQPLILANCFPRDHANINVSLACIWITAMKSKSGQHSLSHNSTPNEQRFSDHQGADTGPTLGPAPWNLWGGGPDPAFAKLPKWFRCTAQSEDANIGTHCTSAFVQVWEGNSPAPESLGICTENPEACLKLQNQVGPEYPHLARPRGSPTQPPWQHKTFWVSCFL